MKWSGACGILVELIKGQIEVRKKMTLTANYFLFFLQLRIHAAKFAARNSQECAESNYFA